MNIPCPTCASHPGWAHDDTMRRREPADVCRDCLGTGVVDHRSSVNTEIRPEVNCLRDDIHEPHPWNSLTHAWHCPGRTEEREARSAAPAIPPSINPREELERVRELAGEALEALADECEGDFRRDVLELHTRAATLLHLVATW